MNLNRKAHGAPNVGHLQPSHRQLDPSADPPKPYPLAIGYWPPSRKGARSKNLGSRRYMTMNTNRRRLHFSPRIKNPVSQRYPAESLWLDLLAPKF
jgi:hypothetical protein